jgi:hypothetical protein
MLSSDLATLAGTYRYLEVTDVKIKELDLDPGPIANAFQSLHARTQLLLNEQLSEPGGKFEPSELEIKMADIIKKLANKYRKIYSTWAKTPQLRKCELGAGVTIIWSHDGKENRVSPSALRESNPDNWWVDAEDSSFDRMVLNYEAFASNIKATPVILPSGEIVVFVAWTDDHGKAAAGILGAAHGSNSGCFVSRHWVYGTKKDDSGATMEGHAITFNSKGIVLVGRTSAPFTEVAMKTPEAFFILDPIPFSAARNVDWYGGGSSIGISDMTGNIQAMRDRLAGLTQWSFGSEYWADRDPHEPLLSLQKLAPFYIGLVDEPSLFKNSNH